LLAIAGKTETPEIMQYGVLQGSIGEPVTGFNV